MKSKSNNTKVKVYRVHKGKRYPVIITPETNMINSIVSEILGIGEGYDSCNNYDNNCDNANTNSDTDIYKVNLNFDEETGELWDITVSMFCSECNCYHDLGTFISEDEFYDEDDFDEYGANNLSDKYIKNGFNIDLPQINTDSYEKKINEIDVQINNVLDHMSESNSNIVKGQCKVELTKLVKRKENLKLEFLK